MDDEVAFLCKLIVIGDTGVGKSNIITQYTKSIFDTNIKPTLGIEFIMKQIRLKDRNMKLQIWDTAGQEKYRALAKNLYRNAFGVMIVYDISKRKSFDSIRKWVEEARNYATEGASVIIVGNKKDLNDIREVSVEEGQTVSQEQGCFFLETSALDNSDKMIEKVFETLAEDILVKKEEENNQLNNEPAGKKIEMNSATSAKDDSKKGCC